MPSTLYLTPDIELAIRHAVDQVKVSPSAPLHPAYFLLPSADAIRRARQNIGNTIGLRFLQFYWLAQLILDQADYPVHRIEDNAIPQIIRHLLREMCNQGGLTTFQSVWEKSGFHNVLAQWVIEMKSQGISPSDVEAYSEKWDPERDRQLAWLYRHYQSYLESNSFSDSEGILALAAGELEKNFELFRTDARIQVIGFDHFNPVQVRILKQLAQRCSELSIYLLWDAHRPANSLALYRLAQTRKILESELNPQIIFFDYPGNSNPALHHLRRTIFEPNPQPFSGDADGTITAVEAPSRESEVRHALRSIKQLLIQGVHPAQIALLAPSARVYKPYVQVVSQEYGIPLAIERELVSNPAIAALQDLLDLAPDFPLRQTMDCLRSPYFCQDWLTSGQIDDLDRLSRDRPVIAGRDQWRFALQPIEHTADSADDDDRLDTRLAAQLSKESLGAIEKGLFAFFDHVTPPESATARGYVLWLQEAIIGLFSETEGKDEPDHPVESPVSLHMFARCQQNEDFTERDLQALSVLMQALRSLISAIDILPDQDGKSISWDSFRDVLGDYLSSAHIPTNPTHPTITFGTLESARATFYDHVFVLGLSEGEFPRPVTPDPLYSEQERAAQELPLFWVHPAEQASLWWQVITNCRKTLTLLRPWLDENGATWTPSPYWENVLENLSNGKPERVPVSWVPDIEQSACQHELLVALAASGATRVPNSMEPVWQAVHKSHSVTLARESWNPPGIYEGYLEAEDLRMEICGRYDSFHRWSPSRLNRYGNCPYGFFAEEVLQLVVRIDPEEGLDVLQRGSLLHELLEGLHRQLARDGLVFAPQNQERILDRLEKSCQEIFPTVPDCYGFRPGALWDHEQQELRRLVQALVSWECEQQCEISQFAPFQQEIHFGMPGSSLPALNICNEQGQDIRVAGVIDRLDRDGDGNFRVIDYKSGSKKYSENDILEGVAFQTALYALAVEPLLEPGASVLESYYLHIPSRATSGYLKFSENPKENETVQAALAAALEINGRVQRCEFPALPGKPIWGVNACQKSCDFSAMCRVNRHGIAKVRRSTEA